MKLFDALIVIVAIPVLCVLLYYCGYIFGIDHAVRNAEIYVTEWEPAETGDYKVNINLDGITYESVLWIY